MLKLVRSRVSMVARRFRSRAVVELENLALRHQLQVLRRQRPGRLRLLAIDRWLWVWLYRLWPRCLEVMVLVKPATIVQWHRQGLRRVCVCSGAGVRGQDGRQWSARFAT
jgi:hypothetical protein